MKQRASAAGGRENGGIPRPNSSSTASPSKLAVRTNSRLVVAASAATARQEPLGRTLSAGGDASASDQQKAGSSSGLQVLEAGYKMLGGGAAYSRGGNNGGGNNGSGGHHRALVSDKLYPR